MIFKRDNLNNKTTYYLSIIFVEVVIYSGLFFTNLHGLILLLVFPLLLIEIISNKRCYNRQKKFITEIQLYSDHLTCIHRDTTKIRIEFRDLIFSFREIKFEKDKSEIEIKQRKRFRNKRIGRLNIQHWKNIFEIKHEFQKNNLTRVVFKPEGFWSKYGGITADVVITTAAYSFGSVAEFNGDIESANDLKGIANDTDFHDLHKEHKINNEVK